MANQQVGVVATAVATWSMPSSEDDTAESYRRVDEVQPPKANDPHFPLGGYTP